MSGQSEQAQTCIDAIEQLCACMRAIASHGTEHAEALQAAQACRRAIATVRPPFALRFLSDGVLYNREPLVLSLGSFRRAQILARVLHQQSTAELRVEETPSIETLVRLAKLLVEATQGTTYRSRLPALPSLSLRPLLHVDPTSDARDETELDRVLRAELYGAARTIEAAMQVLAHERLWSWALGEHVLVALERCLSLGVTATARAQELAAPEWTPPRRALAMTTQVLTVLYRLGVTDLTRRASAHAMLAIAAAQLGGARVPVPHSTGAEHSRDAFEQAARVAQEAMTRAALDREQAHALSPHRLRSLALTAASTRPPSEAHALTRLLHAVFVVEQQRIRFVASAREQRLSRLDLQAWLAGALGRDVDAAFGRALLGSLGLLPPGAHVLVGGRLGVVVGPGKTALTPIALVGGVLTAPTEPVAACSPLGMTPWAQ